MTLITEEARRWADRTYPDVEFTVDARDIAKYAVAIGADDPIHFEREAAVEAGYRDVVAPSMFCYVIRMQAYNLVTKDRLEPDGSPSDDVPPLETKRAMAGETNLEILAPVTAGDVITVSKNLVDMYEKSGRSGPLVFVDMEYVFTNSHGEQVARERFTRIYR
jgi:acyl dehydratase